MTCNRAQMLATIFYCTGCTDTVNLKPSGGLMNFEYSTTSISHPTYTHRRLDHRHSSHQHCKLRLFARNHGPAASPRIATMCLKAEERYETAEYSSTPGVVILLPRRDEHVLCGHTDVYHDDHPAPPPLASKGRRDHHSPSGN